MYESNSNSNVFTKIPTFLIDYEKKKDIDV